MDARSHTQREHLAASNGNGRADIRSLHDVSGVRCGPAVELIVFQFTSYGRLAHFRRQLLAMPQVMTVRIARYAEQAASFQITVQDGTVSGALVPQGTRIIGASDRRVELCVE